MCVTESSVLGAVKVLHVFRHFIIIIGIIIIIIVIIIIVIIIIIIIIIIVIIETHIIIDRSREKVVRQVGNKDVKKINITLNILKTINEEAKVASPALFCCF